MDEIESQGYIVQYMEYNQYFVIPKYGGQSLKIVNHSAAHLKFV